MNSGLVFNRDELDNFWRFVAERHWIWHRRFVLKLPREEWTQDPVLKKNKFTNIYRELDPGTMFVFRNILEREDESRPNIVFNVMLYRLMCSIPTYRGFGFQRLATFSATEFEEYLGNLYKTGEAVFGNAYLISPYSSMGSSFKYVNVARLFGHLQQNFERFWNRLDKAESFERCFKVINQQYGFGPFLSYQVLVDLTYPLPNTYAKSAIIPWSQDDWARLGPGAMRGFRRLSRSPDRLNGLRWLRDFQGEEFERLQLDFPFLRNEDNEEIPLTLANLQNCLCEFHKYRSIQSGTGKSQRIYVPAIDFSGVTTGRLSVRNPPTAGRPR